MVGVAVLISRKQFYTLAEPLKLWRGGSLYPVTIAYETWGELSPERDNVILVLHALTGDSHAAGKYSEDEDKCGWWDPLIGPGRAFDTNRYFVICSNVIGGCQGSTGPSSINPETGYPYAMDFPVITIQDMVAAQVELLKALGINKLLAVTGGSIGGMQAIEWVIRYPDWVENALIFGALPKTSPQSIGFNAVGRQAIMIDPEWKGGKYYPSPGPVAGLSVARMVGMITYQSYEGMWIRFGRKLATRPTTYSPLGEKFDVEGYLEYQGYKLTQRFDANSYLYLTRAMDLYDASEGFDSELEAYDRIRANILLVGISTDWLYPPHEVKAFANQLRDLGKNAVYEELDSIHGHDAFLKEWEQMTRIITLYMENLGDEAHYVTSPLGDGELIK